MIKIELYLRFVLLILVLQNSKIVYGQAERIALDGSFLTGDLCGFWSDARWQQEYTALKDAGMHYVVIQAVADSYPNRATFTLYPSLLPNTEMAKGAYNKTYPDVVDACLRNAELAGIKVFLGIDFNSKWWDLYASDSTWLYNQMELDNNICDELWNNYKSKYPNAFHGWYWSYEIDNLHFQTQEQQKVLITAMNKQLDHLMESEKKLPFMWCPFMNSKVGDPVSYEVMWKNVFVGLHLTDGDIFCPQDGVGAGGLKLDEVDLWYSALRRAVDTKSGLVMWSDVETFRYYNNSFIATTIDRLVSQLKIERPYVDNYISWEYSYYQSPYKANPGFHNTYLNYLQSDTIETIPPTTPENFFVKAYPGIIFLDWDEADDNVGICGYNVFKNSKNIITIQSNVIKNNVIDTVATSFIFDENIMPNTNYLYQIEAYDFAGNISKRTQPVLVSTKEYQNLSNGCSYTLSSTPSDYYPDTYHKELTDGIKSPQIYFTNPQWVGFANIDTLDVVIDLKQNLEIKNFAVDYLLDQQPAIYLPKEITLSVSTDNFKFTDIGKMIDIVPADTLPSKHNYYLTLDNSITARYVKFTTISNNRAWLFVDEYQVFGDVKTAISKSSENIPQEFYLSDNYPNPFNPTTIIKYSIPPPPLLPPLAKGRDGVGFVTLKVYDILGKEVATLVNQKQTPGNYEVQFNASKLPTGRHDLPSGVYLYKIQIGEFVKTKKMILLR